MGKVSVVVDTGLAIFDHVMKNDDVKEALFGTYSDGRTRNLPDAINGEIMSPKQKASAMKSKQKIKKKKNKKKNKQRYIQL